MPFSSKAELRYDIYTYFARQKLRENNSRTV